MKIRSGNVIPWLAALLCLTLAHAGRAADDSEVPMVSNSQATGAQPKLAEQDIWKRWKLAHDPQAASTESRLSPGAPTQANRASGLLGMEVRNQKGERLGHVKDLVIDWKTEQVSYAVISAVSTAAPGIDKLLAVPLAALALSRSGSTMPVGKPPLTSPPNRRRPPHGRLRGRIPVDQWSARQGSVPTRLRVP